jgi:hypothetical protein
MVTALAQSGHLPYQGGSKIRAQGGSIHRAQYQQVYQTGRKCAAGFKKTMKIVFDEILPKWNYTAVPQPI